MTNFIFTMIACALGCGAWSIFGQPFRDAIIARIPYLAGLSNANNVNTPL